MPDQPPRMPGWVKWPAIVLGVLVLVFIGLTVLGIEHGPGLHSPGGGNGPGTPSPGPTPSGSHG
jgi:hypothetical protein